jgi:alpha-L-fucosidase 2
MKSSPTSRRLFLKTTAASVAASALSDAAVHRPLPAASTMPENTGVLPNQRTSSCVLSLRQPAAAWVEGLPLANGVSAAMLWGLPSRVVLSLNHVDFWRDNLGKEIDDYSKYVREAQRLMLDGKPKEANDAYFKNVNMSVMPRQKKSYPRSLTGYTNSFQPIGNLAIEFESHWANEYLRALDLQTGIASMTYKYRDGEEMRQEYFIPAKDDAIVVRILSSAPISGRISFDRPPQAPSPDEYKWSATAKENTILVEGGFVEGVRCCVIANVRVPAAKGEVRVQPGNASINVVSAREILLLVAVDAGKGQHFPADTCRTKMAAVSARSYDEILTGHRVEHSSMFDRVELRLEDPARKPLQDTTDLVARSVSGEYDNALVEQVFQMGRYLMMSCNRAGRRPANLQGIWSERSDPEWDADWHFDTNIEMNHWLVNPTNLDECNLALFKQMQRFVEPGKLNARNVAGCDGILFYGLAGGDGMIWSPEGGFWTGAAAWMAQHYWTHYEFTLDRDFLAAQAYPFIKQVGLFYRGWLVKNQVGKYVSGLSFSPENTPPNGFVNNVHCTMDTAMVREVMRHLIEAGQILDVDHELRPVWQDLHDNVLPYPVSDSGVLKEWPAPLEERTNHRHFSHLYPLFPGDEFTPETTPDLCSAARKAILLRERGRRAWIYLSYSYAACFHARLGEGDLALENLRDLARQSTLSNLLPWFYPTDYQLMQVDAGLAATAAIAEMLLQSHQGWLRLLPALPAQWPTGHFKGLKARGAFVVDLVWKDRVVREASIRSLKGHPCRVRNSTGFTSVRVMCEERQIPYQRGSANSIDFPTEPGKTYALKF